MPSLTGLGERAHLAHGGITLTDHINDVLGLIDCEGLSDIVLVGHSYGGMVVTGVFRATGDRGSGASSISTPSWPQDGQALWDIASDFERNAYIDGQRETPGLCQPFFPVGDRRVSGHPLLTLLQSVKLGGEEGQIGRRTYVYATNNAPTTFTKFRDRVAAEAGWTLHELATSHFVWNDDLDGVMRILLGKRRRSAEAIRMAAPHGSRNTGGRSEHDIRPGIHAPRIRRLRLATPRVKSAAFAGRRGVAQLVERRSPKPNVVGSSPIAPASREPVSPRRTCS